MNITAQTKVYDLLEVFPQLEAKLISINPKFKKLKNPILRGSIGRVASLQQAAATVNIPPTELVNQLRGEVGQPPLT